MGRLQYRSRPFLVVQRLIGGCLESWPQQAQHLIGEIGHALDEHHADDVLTEREQEVMSLLTRGYSNRQIADELIIGVRTAETHVQRILRKLALDNRAQAISGRNNTPLRP